MARLFAINFTSNSTLDSKLDDKGHPLPDFSLLMKYKLCDMSITTRNVSRFIKNLDSKKAIRLI